MQFKVVFNNTDISLNKVPQLGVNKLVWFSEGSNKDAEVEEGVQESIFYQIAVQQRRL